MRVLSLFSGIGGLDLAAEWAGMTTVAFCERDKYCQKVLAKHWPGVPIFDDVTTLKGDQVGTVDVITGGYPCQPFSVAGKRLGADDERYLWPEFSRLIDECRPAWVVGENVAGHVTKGLDAVCDDLEGKGYAVQAFVFPASAVGANHKRERCFVVAHSAQLLRDGGAYQSKCEISEFGNGGCAKDVPNTTSIGQPPAREPFNACDSKANFQGQTGDVIHDGLRHQWMVEPSICRVVNGPSNGFHEDRLRAIGNAVVPQQAYPIFKAIAELSA